MKKLTPLLVLALLFSACSSPAEETQLTQLPDANNEMPSAVQTRSYTTEMGVAYTVTFNNEDILEAASGSTYHDFEIQGTSVYPGVLNISSHKITADQTPEALVDLYFDPSNAKAAVTPTQLGENEVYLFDAPEFSSSTTTFAVIMLEGEALLFMFQSAGPDQSSIDADRAVFMDFLKNLKVN